jgi:hypothetical protein
MTYKEFHQFATNEECLLKAATSDQKYIFKGLQHQQQKQQQQH